MSSTFTGFSEEDLQRIKSEAPNTIIAPQINTTNIKKINRIGIKTKRGSNQYKLPTLQKQDSDDNLDNLFEKCKLSIKTPTSPNFNNNEIFEETKENTDINSNNSKEMESEKGDVNTHSPVDRKGSTDISLEEDRNSNTSVDRKRSTDITPDLVRCVDNYTEDEIAAHRAKLEELQLQQKLMEEQNKKRKEMLAKALADRTKQTEEEVLRLEKIKKELQVLDGQFSQDVAVLRKKIDQACLTYADAEKHYLRVEKEFLNAKIQLQKEKEKKELLTEHLCALITHNETRKAQKLETLMLELASDKIGERDDKIVNKVDKKVEVNDVASDGEDLYVIDGVDVRSGI